MGLQISITDNGSIQRTIDRLDALARQQLPFVTALALTRTGQAVQQGLRAEMSKVFDRPTPYTLNSLRLIPATKQRLQAVVWVKDEWSVGTSGTPATKYLTPEIYGGPRGVKGFEKALRRAGILADNMYAVPAADAPLDRYGNLTGALMVQLLSSLGALHDSLSRQTARSMKRHRTPSEFFVVTKPGSNRTEGIWRRRGSEVRPILHFVKQPQYRPRLRFFEVGKAIAERELPRQFHLALAQTLGGSFRHSAPAR